MRLDDPEVIWMEAIVTANTPVVAEVVAVHRNEATGNMELDVQYYPEVSGAPFEFEPSVDWSRCSRFEIVRRAKAKGNDEAARAAAGAAVGEGTGDKPQGPIGTNQRDRHRSRGGSVAAEASGGGSSSSGQPKRGNSNSHSYAHGEAESQLLSAEKSILDIERYLKNPEVGEEGCSFHSSLCLIRVLNATHPFLFFIFFRALYHLLAPNPTPFCFYRSRSFVWSRTSTFRPC